MSILSSNTTLGSCFKPGEIVLFTLTARDKNIHTLFFFYRILNVSLKRIEKNDLVFSQVFYTQLRWCL